ncbi:MAG: hypothetical protein JXR63_13115 [Spirochaetales bacterium]|nr:hypothetical protein [Spirochaetales bacterium]
MRFKIATLNVWSGLDYADLIRMKKVEPEKDYIKRQELLLSEIKSKDIDIIALNELNPMPTIGKFFAKILDMSYIYNMGVSGLRIGRLGIPANLREGDVLFFKNRLNIKKIGRIRLSGKGFVNNFASLHFDNLTQTVLGELTIEKTKLFICFTHWYASPAHDDQSKQLAEELKVKYNFPKSELKKTLKRLDSDKKRKIKEATRLVNFLKKRVPEDAKVILCGDFNGCEDWEEIKILKNFGFVDTFRQLNPEDAGYTWAPETNPQLIKYYKPLAERQAKSLYHQLHNVDEMIPRRIDYIFSKNIPAEALKSCNLAFETDKSGHSASDHFGLILELEI